MRPSTSRGCSRPDDTGTFSWRGTHHDRVAVWISTPTAARDSKLTRHAPNRSKLSSGQGDSGDDCQQRTAEIRCCCARRASVSTRPPQTPAQDNCRSAARDSCSSTKPAVSAGSEPRPSLLPRTNLSSGRHPTRGPPGRCSFDKAGVSTSPELTRDELRPSGDESQPRALPPMRDRQRGGDALVVRVEDRLGHESPVAS